MWVQVPPWGPNFERKFMGKTLGLWMIFWSGLMIHFIITAYKANDFAHAIIFSVLSLALYVIGATVVEKYYE